MHPIHVSAQGVDLTVVGDVADMDAPAANWEMCLWRSADGRGTVPVFYIGIVRARYKTSQSAAPAGVLCRRLFGTKVRGCKTCRESSNLRGPRFRIRRACERYTTFARRRLRAKPSRPPYEDLLDVRLRASRNTPYRSPVDWNVAPSEYCQAFLTQECVPKCLRTGAAGAFRRGGTPCRLRTDLSAGLESLAEAVSRAKKRWGI